MSIVRLNGVALDAALVGIPTRLGQIVATTTHKNNYSTASAFNSTGDGLAGKLLCIQPDVACYFAVAATNAAEATTTDWLLEANQPFVLNMGQNHKFLALEAVSGTVTCDVYELA